MAAVCHRIVGCLTEGLGTFGVLPKSKFLPSLIQRSARRGAASVPYRNRRCNPSRDTIFPQRFLRRARMPSRAIDKGHSSREWRRLLFEQLGGLFATPRIDRSPASEGRFEAPSAIS